MSAPSIRAARYLRMSSGRQHHSIEHQSLWIDAYALEHGYEIVATYCDPARSGVRIRGRKGLSSLLADVVSGEAGFDVVLVLDVSRWGRFQDIDEAAHYEFICRSAGVAVEYCGEGFANDGSLGAAVMKTLQRAAAAQYSRDLSVKIARVHRELAAKGWRMSGVPGYGLRRQVIDNLGRPGAILEAGYAKGIKSGYVTLVPGPADEIAVVRRIFRLYVVTGMAATRIADLLNDEGILAEAGAAWTPERIRGVLHNAKYAGVNVYGRKANNLGDRVTKIDPAEWVVVEGAFEALVDRELFDQAARLRRERSVRGLSEEAMLAQLKALLDREGFLSATLIDEEPGLACVQVYINRFGGLAEAYRRIDYRTRTYVGRKREAISTALLKARLAALLAERGRLSPAIINGAAGMPHTTIYLARFGTLEEAYRRIGYRGPEDLARDVDVDPSFRRTADRRYIVVAGRLLRAHNPNLEPEVLQRITKALRAARGAAARARRNKQRGAEVRAKRTVRAARLALGERGPVWWTDGVPDQHRRVLSNSTYGDDVGLATPMSRAGVAKLRYRARAAKALASAP